MRRGGGTQISRITMAACLAIHATGCSPEEPRKETMRTEHVVASLVVRDDLWEASDGNARPVRAATIAPMHVPKLDATALPAIEMIPPCTLAIDLPPTSERAQLRFAVGLSETAFQGSEQGTVIFGMAMDGAPVYSERVAYGSETPLEARVWNRMQLALDGAKRVVLSTELAEGSEGAPEAGFALLELVEEARRPRERATVERPNVVMVVVDTLRADRLGAYGASRATPNLDGLAARGAIFRKALAPSSWTLPATASLLTALSPPEHGAEDSDSCFLAHELVSVAEAFQAAGWSTAGFSVNTMIQSSKDFDQGFEHFTDYDWVRCEEVVGDVVDWVEEMGEWRFFVYVHLGDPHDYDPDRELVEGQGIAHADYDPMLWGELTHAKQHGLPYDRRRYEWLLRYRAALYEASVAEVDQAMGRLLATLEAQGLLEKTVVAFTSDHGEEFLEHGLTGHALQLHEESLRVPLILAGPGVAPRYREELVTESRFLAPTLLRLAGIEPVANLRGGDLLDHDAIVARKGEPVFATTEKGRWRSPGGDGFFGVGSLHAVRQGRWLCCWAPDPPEGGPLVALFDLASDPRARHDVAAEHPREVARFVAAIRGWLEAGDRVRPKVLSGGEAAAELLEALGYGGDGR